MNPLEKCVITRLLYEEKPFRFLFLLDENRKPIEIIPEPIDDLPHKGNLYVGRVEKILKFPSACFVRIEENQSVYLPLDERDSLIYAKKDSKKEGPHENDLILLQILKESVRKKDPVACDILTFSGDHMEVSFGLNKYGNGKIHVSRKISEERCKECKNYLKEYVPENFSVVLRTNSAEIPMEDLRMELVDLIDNSNKLMEHAKLSTRMGRFYHGNSGILDKALHFQGSELITDDKEIYESLKEKIPVKLYEDEYPIHMMYSLETMVQNSLKKEVHLKSGASIVIDATEAMYVIDVNSGNAGGIRGKKGVRPIDTNLEACERIAKEIRLRNLSGMILVDFINMESKEEENILLQKMRDVTKEDSVRVRVHDMTALGLMEITREKHRTSLKQVLTGHI